MSVLLQGNGDPIYVTDGLGPPDHWSDGIPYEADGTIAVSTAGGIDHYSQGLPFTAGGRIAIGQVDPVRFGSGSAPFDGAGRLAFDLTGQPNIYDNGELAGGGVNIPPTNHGIGFGTADYFMEPIADNPGYFAFVANTDRAAGRVFLTYDIGANNPGLVVGDTYRYEVECWCSDDLYTAAITAVAVNGVTIVNQQRVSQQNQWTRCFYEFTIDDPAYGLTIRAGTGTTAVSPYETKVRYPTLRNISNQPAPSSSYNGGVGFSSNGGLTGILFAVQGRAFGSGFSLGFA